MEMHIERDREVFRNFPTSAPKVEDLCESEMRTWSGIWLHRWAVEYVTLRYVSNRPHPIAFANAFKSIRDQIASGVTPPMCCETARVLAEGGR